MSANGTDPRDEVIAELAQAVAMLLALFDRKDFRSHGDQLVLRHATDVLQRYGSTTTESADNAASR